MQKGGRYPGRYLALLEDYGDTAKACRELGGPDSAGAEITEDSEGEQEGLPEGYIHS